MIYTQLSDWTLKTKPTDPKVKADISGARHFNYKVMSEKYFLQALQEGHGFCPLHRDQAQADQAITNIITFDFDHSTIPLDEFIKGLSIKPAFTYYSYSNGRDGQYRYRLIYQLAECVTGSEYDAVHQHIAEANGWQQAPRTGDQTNTYDPLARNQYFFSGTSISYYPDNIINEYTHTQHKPAPAPTAKKARQTKPQADNTTYFTDEFKQNFGRLTPHAYTQLTAEHAFTQLQQEGSVDYITHTPLPEEDADTPTIQYPKDYIETPRRLWWDKANRTYYVNKWRDGEQRHRKLYMAGIILRKLNPQLSPDKLLFALCREFATYYDNADKKYTTADVIHIVERVLSADINRELGRWKRKNYIVNVSYCKKHGVSKRSVVGAENGKRNAAERAKRYEQIAEHYDPDKTDAANLLRLKQKGVQCSLRTLKRYKVDYGYTEPTQAPKETPTEQAPPKAESKPTPAQCKHHTPPRETPQQPTMTPNYAFDSVMDTETIEGIKKMLRRGLNNSSTIN